MSEEDSYFPATIDVEDLLSLLFGEKVASYSANPGHCPGRLRSALNVMKAFEEKMRRAISLGDLKVVFPGLKFYWHSLDKNKVFLWLHHKGILKWLEDQGLEIDDDVKEAVEKAALAEKSEPPQAEANTPPAKSVKNKPPKAHPAPTTKRAKDIALKGKCRSIYNELVKKGSPFTYQDILNHTDFQVAIEDSGHNKHYNLPPKTLQNWLADFKKTN